MPPVEIGRTILASALRRTTQGAAGAKEIGVSILGDIAAGNLMDVLLALKDQVDAKMPSSRGVYTTGALQGGGNMTDDRTLSILDSTELNKGAVRFATTEETTTGESTSLAVHPAGLKQQTDALIPSTREVNTTAPLSGGGSLSQNRTLSVADATQADKGVSRFSSEAETLTGTAEALMVSPKTMKTQLDTKASTSDARFPTQTQKDGLAGSFGTPSTSNPYLTSQDPRTLSYKQPVRAASLDHVNVTTGGIQPVDDVNLVAGDRVLLKNQIFPKDNGIYVVSAGPWTRATDANSSANLVPQSQVRVMEGTQASAVFYLSTPGPYTVNTDPITFTIQPGTGGGGGYTTLYDEGTARIQRTEIDVIGAGVEVVDNPNTVKTEIRVPGLQLYNGSGAALPIRPKVRVNRGGALVPGASDDPVNAQTIITLPSAPSSLSFLSLSTPLVLTDMASTLTELAVARKYIDLTSINEARLGVGCTKAGSTNAQIRVQYLKADGVTWAYLDNNQGPFCAINTAGDKISAAWVTLHADARIETWIRVVGIGGNATIDPAIRSVYLNLK